MSLNYKIKELIAGYIDRLWPLIDHKPSGKPINLKDDKAVFVFCYTSEEELDIIKATVKKVKQLTNLCAVVAFSWKNDSSISEKDDGFLLVSLNDFNLLGRKKKRLVDWLNDNNFDLLLSFSEKNSIFYNKLISSIKADFKAGLYNPDNVNLFDLTIKQESDDISKQIEIFTHYLNKLNINK